MLSVQPQRFELPRDELSMGNEPSLREMNGPQAPHSGSGKQQDKKSMITPYKILLGIALFFILTMVTYKVYTEFSTPANKSQISSVHGQIIQYADSTTGKQKSSSSQSTAGKSTKTNNKPNISSRPASKTPISSNNNAFSSSDDDGNNEEDQNQGDKNKKILDKNKSSIHGKIKLKKTGQTTEDSDSVQSENSDDFAGQGLMFSDFADGPTPLVGSTRK